MANNLSSGSDDSDKREQVSEDYKRFKDLDFDGFRRLAADSSLSPYQKIGFPDAYRAGHEEAILADLNAKLPALRQAERTIVDLGCGCSDLPQLLIRQAGELTQSLVMVDSEEMLTLLPAGDYTSYAGYYPQMPELQEAYRGHADAVIVYSVMHYVLAEGNLFRFLDAATELLAPGGQLILGDLPNVSMRRRFFATEAGRTYHQEYTGTATEPPQEHLQPAPATFDDGIIFGILQRYRNFGFQTYLMPQATNLPMSNRREDLIITRF